METAVRDLLRQVPLFSRLDDAMLVQLAARARRRRFGPREALFHAGDPGRTLYVVVAGRVSIQKPTPSGQTLHLAQRGPGEHFGELALLDDKPRMADAVTVTACDLLMLDQDEFAGCLKSCPAMGLAVMAALAERLRQAADEMERHRSQDVPGRLAGALLALAEADGQEEAAGLVRLCLPVSQQDLADQIGTTRESVSRAMGGLRRAGAVRAEGRSLWVVLDTAKLRRRRDS